MLDPTPLFQADLAVQIHALSAIEAIVLTPFALFRRRRDRIHKIAGYAWSTNMLIAAFSSFFISGFGLIGPFGPIHALSLLVLFNVVWAIRAIRRRDIRAHEAIMKQTAFWGLGVAGGLTFVPGRLMHDVIFGPAPNDGTNPGLWLSFSVVGIAAAYTLLKVARERRAAPAR
jgi:uncharacterized membrane protein